MRLLALILLALSSDALAQQWRIVDNVRQRITLQSLDTQSLKVYDLEGNLIATHAVIAPYLQSTGILILQNPDTSNFYLSRVAATVQWQLSTVSPPASTLRGYLELDGKWYSLSTGFVQAFYSPNDHLVDASASNCTADGEALPAATNPRLTLSGMAINLAPTEPILIEHLVNADVIRMKSRTANISCNGQVISPIAEPDPIFRDGLEQLP